MKFLLGIALGALLVFGLFCLLYVYAGGSLAR